VLSILIPIYNVKIVKLVDELISQCQKAKIGFEIICLDDGSKNKIKEVNEAVNHRFGVNYVELSENIGRAKIRNRLAKIARYDWLLFLDCDSKPASKKFIKTYVSTGLNKDHVYIGGTKYDKRPPKARDKLLHWHYGSNREALKAKRRNRHPIQYFHSNNFVISRDVILAHPFDESLSSYGYEDLSLGQLLADHNVSITHIDNPVLHRGIKKATAFITDQISAVYNLAHLYQLGKVRSTRLISLHKTLERLGILTTTIKWIDRRVEKYKSALEDQPKSLYKLDLLKLYYFDNALMDTLSEEKTL